MMKDAFVKVNRAGRIIVVIAVLGSLAGCGTHKPFELFEDTTVIKSRTIAVISADGSKTTTRLAEALTNELKKRSTFKVFSQARIDLRVGKYPITIKKGRPQNPEKPVWFAKGEKAKVDAMQAQLKVYYVFVVWTERSRVGTSASDLMTVNGNVLEYPKGRVIGYSFISGRESEGDDVNEMVKKSATMMADKFIRAARAETPRKKDEGSRRNLGVSGEGLSD